MRPETYSTIKRFHIGPNHPGTTRRLNPVQCFNNSAPEPSQSVQSFTSADLQLSPAPFTYILWAVKI